MAATTDHHVRNEGLDGDGYAKEVKEKTKTKKRLQSFKFSAQGI